MPSKRQLGRLGSLSSWKTAVGAEGRSRAFLFHAKVGRFGLETCHPSVEEFTAVELHCQHLRGVGNVLIRTWEREMSGMRVGVGKKHSSYTALISPLVFSVCGECGVNVLGGSFPLPSTKQTYLRESFVTCFLLREA